MVFDNSLIVRLKEFGTGIEYYGIGKIHTMKTTSIITILIAALLSTAGASAQTIYNISATTKYSTAGIPAKCTNCVIKIADGVTLTIDKPVELKNVSFTGGSVSKSTIVVKDDNVNFLAPGSFTNINAEFDHIDFTNTGSLTVTNSSFTFKNNSKVSADSSVSLISSSYSILDDSKLESTEGVFSLLSSSLSIGDGSGSSNAFASFNGSTLNLLDPVSFVTVLGKKNYYYNLNSYIANGQVISTLNNNLNCQGSGISACSAPILRGPSAINAAGISSFAILPVNLESFIAKSSGNNVTLTWITANESNSAVFEIERSNDGVNYAKVGSVNAKGNSSASSKYTFTEVIKSGTSFNYRLKMVDNNNRSTYSPIVKLSFSNTTGTIKTYPNPATDYFAVDGSGVMQVQVISMNGAIVKVIKGYVSNEKVSLNGMLAGNYVVKVTEANGSTQAFKMIVTH